jgi:hypothetical protein
VVSDEVRIELNVEARTPRRSADMAHIFGSHTVDNGGIDMAVRRAANAGLSTLQCFTAIPKFYGDKSTIRPERVRGSKPRWRRRASARSTWWCTRRTC